MGSQICTFDEVHAYLHVVNLPCVNVSMKFQNIIAIGGFFKRNNYVAIIHDKSFMNALYEIELARSFPGI